MRCLLVFLLFVQETIGFTTTSCFGCHHHDALGRQNRQQPQRHNNNNHNNPIEQRRRLLSSSSSLLVTTATTTATSLADHHNDDDHYNDDDDTDDDTPTYFTDLGLYEEAIEAIEAQDRWYLPTPIQRLAIPRLLEQQHKQIMQHQDDDDSETTTTTTTTSIWAEAPTGSGKTAAFVLPLLQKLLLEKEDHHQEEVTPSTTKNKIRSLILCPTRELAIQIGNVVQDLSSYMTTIPGRGRGRNNNWGGCNSLVITGGMSIENQVSQLADWIHDGETIDVVIATPGRLVDVLTRYNNNNNNNNDDDDANYDDDDEAMATAAEAALERRLLQALDENKDSLSLEQIQTLKLDRTDDEGREQLGNLLEGLEYLVLDEADRLLGRAFEKEVNSVLDLLRRDNSDDDDDDNDVVKTWLFSATFPKAIEPRVDTVLKRLGHTTTTRISCANSDRFSAGEGEEISATLQKKLQKSAGDDDESSTSMMSASAEGDGSRRRTRKTQQLAQVGPASTIDLRTIRLEKRDRTSALKQLWAQNEANWRKGGVLVFVSTRYGAEHVSRKLRRIGIRSSELHGKLNQDARERRLHDLQTGKIHILLATDLASRGLDVVGLSAVVNYDLPRSTADFVHRVGRTGRAGRRGTAITFVTPTTESHYDLIEKRHIPPDAVKSVEREMLPGLEVDEEQWKIQAESSRIRTPGAGHSKNDLAHDRMFGGIKGKRKSKKDRLREKAAAEAAAAAGRS